MLLLVIDLKVSFRYSIFFFLDRPFAHLKSLFPYLVDQVDNIVGGAVEGDDLGEMVDNKIDEARSRRFTEDLNGCL